MARSVHIPRCAFLLILLAMGPPLATAAPPLGFSPTETTMTRLADTEGGAGAGDPSRLPNGCIAETPIRLDEKTCVSQAVYDALGDGWKLHVNPDGTYWLTAPPAYNPDTGQWGNWNPAQEPCNPNIEVKLKQAALAGSQSTRAISDTQLSYPQVDPLIAVNNPKKDGYGGICTVNIFIFDELWRRLGTAYEQIKDLIEALKNLSVDDLFDAGCAVINHIFGDVQNQLINEITGGIPPTPLQQLANQIRIGFLAPLDAFIAAGLTGRPTAATIPGVATSNPLVVYYVPGKGYVYVAQSDSGMSLVLYVSPTPLLPEDTASPEPPGQ